VCVVCVFGSGKISSFLLLASGLHTAGSLSRVLPFGRTRPFRSLLSTAPSAVESWNEDRSSGRGRFALFVFLLLLGYIAINFRHAVSRMRNGLPPSLGVSSSLAWSCRDSQDFSFFPLTPSLTLPEAPSSVPRITRPEGSIMILCISSLPHLELLKFPLISLFAVFKASAPIPSCFLSVLFFFLIRSELFSSSWQQDLIVSLVFALERVQFSDSPRFPVSYGQVFFSHKF